MTANKLLKNEQVFARANDNLADRAGSLMQQAETSPDFRLSLYCECANKKCLEKMNVSIKNYDQAHNQALQFVVKPEHVLPEFETVVSRTPDYWVIEKKPEKLSKEFEV